MALPLITALALAGCADVRVSGINIDGTRWIATSVAGLAPIPSREPTVRFDGGRINANDGCNGITGQTPVVIVNEHLELGRMLNTAVGCIDPANGGQAWEGQAVEDAFDAALDAADWILLRDGQLVIAGSMGELVFKRAP